ncbi:hypothetical protein [Proteiniclasticum sp.]|uniref:hypothetical protein n=1 Tax=Proteiniclasticum sp. TaxID=2053595 RepID=UPI00289C0653|nr:hypothetical protein [Proteiniclasticum sp.]
MIQFEKNPMLTETMKNLMKSMRDMRSYLSDVLNYLEDYMTPAKEKELLSLLKKYDIPEDHLDRDIRSLLENPYFKDIRLEKVETDTVRYQRTVIPKRTLMNMDFHVPLGMYLFHYHPIGYFNEDLELPVLMEGKNVWMSPAVSEIESMRIGIDKGHGKCVTFGLGLGLIIYLWLLKDEVESVTAVEVNKDVIDLFEKYILPQFKTDKKVQIIHASAYDKWNKDFLDEFDYVYADFWESNEDGLECYTKLMEKKIDLPHIDYWIEDSILSDIKYMVTSYLNTLYRGESVMVFMSSIDADMKKYAIKINKYFKRRTDTIRTEEELLELIHSRKVLREILSI